jgi:sporulation related protein
MARAEQRRTAVAAADTTCPRCGSSRAPRDRYCLDCGLRLPTVEGGVASFRRRWVRRLGWYPGDWIALALPTLLVAIAGAAVAIVVADRNRDAGAAVLTATSPVPVAEPAATAPSSQKAVDTTTLPVPPEPGSPTAGGNGRIGWPANRNGWTIVLVSYPRAGGRASAVATAAKAVKAHLRQVGILDSGAYASLQPGYYVVFTGVFPSKDEADGAVSTARQAGFAGAYSRQIAR